MNAPLAQQATTFTFELDGRPVQAQAGETLLEVADRMGVEIPRLCYKPGYPVDGNCRSCMVEIEGERVLAPSCCRAPRPGMKVRVDSDRAVRARKVVLEMLLSDMPPESRRPDSELTHWARQVGLPMDEAGSAVQTAARRFPERTQPVADQSHPAMLVNLDACIQCTRCVRACRDVQGNDVIGLAGRGDHARIVFDQEDPMGQSSCVACGECVQACPTGALMPRVPGQMAAAQPSPELKAVDSLCPFCGVGCQLTYHVDEPANVIRFVTGRNGPANEGRLCVKGRFGFDYAMSAERLTVPLIRRSDAPKDAHFDRVPANWRDAFREASWDEALDHAGLTLARIRDTHGPDALAGFGSAKGSNEEAYLFQKLVRTGFRTNNVDHCTRLCHASSVVALLEGLGSGAVSNPVSDVQFADVIVVIGSNPTVNHPVAATFIKNAVRRGASLVVMDPRRTDIARHATHVLQFRADSDVALLNAMLNVIIAEGLVDEDFVARRTSNFAAIRDGVAAFTPEAMAPVCGIPAETIRAVARLYAKAKSAMILWGMGVSQHVHGTDNARCLIALAMITGQIGRPGTGLHPLRGQNNVQGASDVGLIPMVFPDYQRVDNEAAAQRFEALWGTPLNRTPGLTVVEIMNAASAGQIRGMYVQGENPAMSDPDLNHARHALAGLEMLVVQDIFPTETAWLADVILPASAFAEKTGSFTNTDRMVQLGQAAIQPPGLARQDLWIINQMGRRLGLDWNYSEAGAVFDEMRLGMDSIAGMTWARLQQAGSITYPCASAEDPGQPVIFTEHFMTPDTRARLVPTTLVAGNEQPDPDFPIVLITGRQLEHWHTGSMTRRAFVLDATEPQATVTLNGREMARLGLQVGGRAEVASRRGTIRLSVRQDDGVADGNAFIPFAYAEAAANLLTNPALDPFGKIPEFKYCAVRIAPVSESCVPERT